MEYSEDALANMGLPESWLGFDSNCVTQIENKYVRRESNWILKKIESNQIETIIESNKIGDHESNTVINIYQYGTEDADDVDSVK